MHLTYLFLSFVLVPAVWAEPAHVEPSTSGIRAAASPSELVSPETFRNYFLSFLDRNYSLEDQNKMLYLPTDEMQQLPSLSTGASGEDFLKALRTKYQGVTQQQLFEKGKNTPSAPIRRQLLEDKLAQNPITMVLVPGIFGEFIKNKAFEEFFKEKAVFDPQKQLWTVDVKDSKGRTLFKLVIFNTKEMSFESLGKIEKIGALFSKRLEAYTKEAKPQHIALIGYSRGTMTALEMLSVAQSKMPSEQPEWFKKVRAMISLGGVTTGSDLADDATTPGTVANKQLNAFIKLGFYLDKIPSTASSEEAAEIIARNTMAYGQFVKEMSQSGGTLSPLIRTAMKARRTDLKSMAKIAKDTWDQFGLSKFTSEYSRNVERFKKFVLEVKEGVRELSTKSRLEWWKEHEIPTGIQYYTVGAVMGGPESPLVKGNSVAYDPGTLDDAFQFNSHKDFNLVSRVPNDGQVALDRVQFINDFIVRQNPEQKPIQSSLLGIVGSPHWGLALRSVYPPAVNPFPREALLKAIAVSVADGIK